MDFLIACRALQGIGAGGNFAVVYIVLADISRPEERGKTPFSGKLRLGLGKRFRSDHGRIYRRLFLLAMDFFINVPLGFLSLAGVGMYLVEIQVRKKKTRLILAAQ
jgi:MFS family permease